jgi:sporulation related protein
MYQEGFMQLSRDGMRGGAPLPLRDIFIVVLTVTMLLFLGGACSKDEPDEVGIPRVVRPMPKPVAKTQAAAPVKKARPDTAQKTLKTPAQGKSVKEAAPEAVKKITGTAVKKAAPAGKAAPPVKAEKKASRAREGYYRVKSGDTLSGIAGRDDVYGDSDKWPSLFRLNIKALSPMAASADIHLKKLAPGIELKFLTPGEVRDNLRRLGPKVWAINVFSSLDSKKIVPNAVKLMRKGHRVYLTTVTVKGKDWLRLRAGFFTDKSKANKAGKEIMSLLGINGAWVARIGEQEKAEFGGY